MAETLLNEGEKTAFCERKIATAVFYGERILPRCSACAGAILASADTLSGFSLEWL